MRHPKDPHSPGNNFNGRPVCTLMVTDSPELAQRVQDLLDSDEKVVLRVTDSLGSIKLLGSGSFDLVMVDADLRQIPARQMVEAVKSAAPESHVAIVLGWWDERASEISTLCNYFINKPFRRSQLSDLFQGLLTFYSTDGNFRRILEEVTSEEEENDAVA